jgi:O-antigen/teichoic acid export membrane protein
MRTVEKQPRPVPSSLSQKAAVGFAWLIIQTLITKIVTIAGQIALARFLRPEDFGLVSLAYATTAIVGLIQYTGLQQILIQRQARFSRWANATFWLAMVTHVLATLAMIVAAPIAGNFYGNSELTGLILVLAVTPIIGALQFVPMAWLQSQLQFRPLSFIGVGESILTVGLSVVFAWLGFNAYSFVLPIVLVGLLRVVVLWLIAKPAICLIRLNLQVRRWRYLIGNSFLLFATAGCVVITLQGDYIILGLFYSKAEVGIYYFGYNLSMQATQLLTRSLLTVLFPALNQLQREPDRQQQAFLRATRLLNFVGMPLCLVQAALADPVMRLLFGTKWLSSIPILQILSIGMALQLSNSSVISLLQAQGRFRTWLSISASCAIIFAALVLGAALTGGAVSVAIAVALYSGIAGLIHLYAALQTWSKSWKEISLIYFIPFAVASIVVGGAVVSSRLMLYWAAEPVLQAFAILMISFFVYLPIIRRIAPNEWADLSKKLPKWRKAATRA